MYGKSGTPEYRREYAKVNWVDFYTKTAYHHAARRAGRQGVPFTILLSDLRSQMRAQENRCALSGIDFVIGQGKVTPYSPSMDRVKPELGYVLGNVRFILHGLNDLKGTGTDEDLLYICRRVVERHPFP